VLSSTNKRSSSPTVAFSLSTSTYTAANLQAPQIQNGVRIFFTSFSHYLSPPSPLSSLFVEALGAISRGFGDRQYCTRAPPSRVAVVSSSGLMISSQPPTLDTLANNMSFPAPDAERTWHEEARFAAPAELAMYLRWGLACLWGQCRARPPLLGHVRRVE